MEQPHVVSVWPLDERTRKRFSVDINGTWADDDIDGIRRRHRRGERVIVSVQALAGEQELLEAQPSLRPTASRDLWGEPSRVPWYDWLAEPVLALSIADPTFRAYLVDRGREAVDLEADGWFIDEIQTSALLISREPHGTGFGQFEMDAFLQHSGHPTWADLLQADYGVSVEASTTAATFLLDETPEQAAIRDAFFADYERFQEEHAFRLMSQVVADVRAYADDRSHDLAVGANLAGMGAYTDWSPLTAPIWSDSLDFVVFEHNPVALATTNAPYLMLGRATTPGMVAAMPGLELAADLDARGDYDTYLAVAYAEALAFEGTWGIGYWWEEMGWAEDAMLPAELERFTTFVREHPGLYTGARAPRPVAVVYPNGEVLDDIAVHNVFFTLCETLLRQHVLFDVVYEGDDRFRAATPDLGGYAHVQRPGDAVPDGLPALGAPEGVLTSAYERAGNTIVHVVDRRYDPATDSLPAPSTVAIELAVDAWEGGSVEVFAPGRSPRRVTPSWGDGRLSIEVPDLDVYAVVVLAP